LSRKIYARYLPVLLSAIKEPTEREENTLRADQKSVEVANAPNTIEKLVPELCHLAAMNRPKKPQKETT
jgi:hypothetical protein